MLAKASENSEKCNNDLTQEEEDFKTKQQIERTKKFKFVIRSLMTKVSNLKTQKEALVINKETQSKLAEKKAAETKRKFKKVIQALMIKVRLLKKEKNSVSSKETLERKL